MRRPINPNISNRKRNAKRKATINKAVLHGGLTTEQADFLDSNGIGHDNGFSLGVLKVLLFKTDDNGDLVSYFEGVRIAPISVINNQVKENELWVCVVEPDANNVGTAQPLYRIESEDIVNMNGRTDILAEFMWENNPEDIVKHLDLNEKVTKLDELESDLEKLKRENETLRSKSEERKDSDATLRTELEEEFKRFERKLIEEHKASLAESEETFGLKEKELSEEIESLNATIRKLGSRDDSIEVQNLRVELAELEKENESLETELDAKRNELHQKIEELSAKNVTDSSYYEGIIEGLKKNLNDYRSNSEAMTEKCGDFALEIERLTARKQSLEDLVKAKNAEMEARVEELRLNNRTYSDHYETKVDELEDELNRYRNEVETLRKKMESHVPQTESDLPDHRDETITEIRRELDSQRVENNMLRQKLVDSEYEIRCLTRDGAKPVARSRLGPMSGSVIRVSADEFKCSLIDEGTYTVRINADRTIMRFVPDIYGTAECRNGIIRVPDLDRIEVLGNRFGELKWKMVNGNTLEVSI